MYEILASGYQMSSKITMGVSKGLPQEKDRAVRLIIAFTGENPSKLAKMSMDQLLDILSYILKCEKNKVASLLREHDQNIEIDDVGVKALWHLVSKGVVKPKKSKFATLTNEVYDQLKFLMSSLVRSALFRAENQAGPATSVVNGYSNTKQRPVIRNASNLYTHHVNTVTIEKLRAANTNELGTRNANQ